VTKREVGSGAVAVAVGLLVALLPTMSSAQSDQTQTKTEKAGKFGPVGPEGQKGGKGKGKAVPSGPAPRMADGKPDLQGVWTPANFSNSGGPFDLQPWAAALLKERRDNLSKEDPEGFCLPAGVPRISPFPQKTIQTPAVLVILEEGNVQLSSNFPGWAPPREGRSALDGRFGRQMGWRYASRRYRRLQR
jgi:hypothetical protein